MPKIKSAKKAIRQSRRKQKMNLRRKDSIKTNLREYKKALSGNDFEKAKEMLPSVYQALDKAARTNLIKKNKAARLKSRLTRQLKAKSSKTSS
jgi:small subunit ribosomal protein S20